MQISDKMVKALNDQINMELGSGYAYLAMSAYFLDKGLKGFAQWMRSQAAEELGHAMRIFDYLDDRSGRITLQPVGQPQGSWQNNLEVFKDALAHEIAVTDSIHNLVSMATEEKDWGTVRFLDWFVNEQVEEESSVGDVVTKIELVGDNPAAVYVLDKELGERKTEEDED